ncbi:non-ribosomal peptide synthetase, partial [Gordonia sp. 'Campus']|uniref:non-ribosomal peptide synthetase n=1 Tax=Gordonia sp. 'Campus' TaxID=2915824 RepID=UPI001EE442EB
MTSETSTPRTRSGPTPVSAGQSPVLRSLAFAATHAGDAEAMPGTAGPISFRTLWRRVSASAVTLAERGVDPGAAVRATVTALMPRTGLTAVELASAASAILHELDKRIDDVLGTGDRESLPGLVRIAARRRGDAPALSDLDGAAITYRELDAETDRLARALAARGAGPDTLVGVALPRSVELIVTLLAVLKTGAAYLPLDRTHPRARLHTIVDDAAPVLIVADADTVRAWDGMPAPLTTREDLLAVRAPAEPGLPTRVAAHAAAYVMYTSGSTGTPKGVVVTHDNVVSLLVALDLLVESSPEDVWSMFHSYAFDVSVGEIWAALVAGGRLVVLDHATTRAPDDVVEAFEREGVTIVNFTPSSFYQFGAAVRPPHGRRIPDSVRRLHFSGELLDYEHVRTWQADRDADGSVTRPGADVAGPQLNNMYGPTETTVYMTRRELTRAFVDAATASDIGTPLLGSRVHVLDGRLAPLPDGVPGELYVSGVQVTRGFLRRHGQTATRYVANPFGPPGTRMYRTGDVGVARNGSIEFVGRRDGQVKLRGFRIELGEVEAALSALDGVDAAGAVIRTLGDTEHLVGYLVANHSEPLSENELRARLSAAVPDYMIPTRYVWLDKLPLTVNGKLDRDALPEPGAAAGGVTAEPPATATEVDLAALIAEILGVNDVGVTDSLFDLGGNSLTATRVAARAADFFDTTVTARDVFAAPTVRGLAAVVDERLARDADAPASVAAGGDVTARIRLRPVDRDGVLPLSPAQQRIWFLESLDPGGAGYLIPAVLRLGGAPADDAHDEVRRLQPAVVAAALDDLLARHEVLRTRFVAPDGVPEQRIAAPGDTRHDVRADPPIDLRGAGETEIADTIAEITTRGFDLELAAPVRARLIRIAEDDWILVLVVHHIISDGGSVAPMVTDFVDAYRARLDGKSPGWAPLPVQYVDYAVWQRARLGDPADPGSLAARQLAYWRTRLSGAPELVDLPLDRPRAALRDDAGAEMSTVVDATTWAGLTALADRHGATPFMVVHALLAVTLMRSGSSEDVVIGTPVAGRGERALDGLIGMFVNTLALRTSVRRDAGFDALLAEVRDTDIAGLDHADLPFESVVDEVVTARSTAHPPVFQVALAFQNADRPTVELPGLTVAEIEPPVTTAKVDLQLTVLDTPGRPAYEDTRILITYATALFDAHTVESFARRFLALARAVVESPGTPVGDLPAGDDTMQAVVRTPEAASSPLTMSELLAAAVRENPDGVAVVEGGRSLTYDALDRWTTRVAHVLRRRGAVPGAVVALATPRSLAGTVGFWAVARTGAAVAPIDPGLPGDRIRYMLDTVDARLGLVTPEKLAALETSSATTEWLLVDDRPDDPDGPAEPAPRPDLPSDGPTIRVDDTAYVIFTSGSTGRPKGVAVTHRGVADLVTDARRRLELTSSSRVLRFAAPGFDATVFETLIAVAAASTMVVAPEGVSGGAELAAVISGQSVTHAAITPTALATVSDALAENSFPSLAVVCVAGDVCSPELVRAWSPARTMLNLYGPTETTIWATSSAPLRPDQPITVGGPIAGMEAMVLDPRLHPVPPGVSGELYLAGPALATGYLRQTGLTAERFVAAPFGEPGQRMYRTGDIVRWRRRGEEWALDFLGRSDFQVKIRGFRIELGEIDAVLGELDSVDFVTSAGVEHPSSGETVLVSWVRGRNGIRPDTGLVTAHAARRLPAHMVPDAVVVLDEIPLAATGKLDRAALPPARFDGGVYTEPESDTERAVAAVYAAVLGLADVGGVSATASFFDLGGTSLSATRVAARLGAVVGAVIPVRTLFESPTVRDLAAVIDVGLVGTTNPGPVPGPVPGAVRRPDPVPVSYAQRRMWFLNRFEPDSSAYVIPVVIRLRGRLDVSAMRAALHDVVERHEVLRTVYPTTDDDNGTEPVQVICDDWSGRLIIGHTSADVRTGGTDAADVERAIRDVIETPFDVTVDLPFRARIITVAPNEHVLVIALHHIAADGESAPVLSADIARAYGARGAGSAPDWPTLDVQYADYALWQRDRLGDPADSTSLMARQLRYWSEHLDGVPDVLPLPTDRPRSRTPDRRAQTVRWSLPAAVVTGLRHRATEHRATLFMVVHTALAAVLRRLTATSEIAVATPVAGRGHEQIDRLVGMFVNTVILRVDVDPHLTLAALLDRVRRTDLTAFDNADVPFERVVDTVRPARIENAEPLAQVMLVHSAQHPAALTASLGELSAEFVETEETAAKFDLTIGVRESEDGGLAGGITYATALFDAATAEMIASAMVETLSEFATDADVPVADIALLTTAEEQAQQRLSTGESVTLPADTLADAVLSGPFRTADSVALRCGDRTVAHREFTARVATLARELLAIGVGPEDAVVVCLPRSVELVVAVHAVVAAGGQYVPVAPDAPPERVRYMVETARARTALVADQHNPLRGLVGRTIVVDSTVPVDLGVSAVTDAERRLPLRPDHAAYTLFTSGSTGRPKGVTVSHRAVLNRLRWGLTEFGLGPDDAVLLKTPFTFDVSVPELFIPLMAGARLIVAPDDAHLDPHAIAGLIDSERVTTVHFVPSLLGVFLDAVDRTTADAVDRTTADAVDRTSVDLVGRGVPLPSLRHLYCSGEALPPATLHEVGAVLPHVRVHNLFGPTEAAVEVTSATLDTNADTVPMGRPVWNTRTYVLDARLRPLPTGVAGELYLGGVQLARGYASRPDLTADRFVADPAGDGARLYRTGDLVRRTRAGELEYLGRTDFQVKLRGLRIELGEIESVLAAVDGVRQAVVTVAATAAGAEQLIGYLIGPDADALIGPAQEAVARSLPAYMRPTLWVTLPEAPLSSAGKLDRKSLPAPRFDPLPPFDDAEAPANDAERTVASVVGAVLGVRDVPVTRSFFELGGDSIASIRLTSMLRAAGFVLTPRDVFAASTVRELAALARMQQAATLDELPGGGIGPVAMAPGAAWMLDLADDPADIADFSQSTVLTLPAGADEVGLRAVVRAVVAAHPMLTASLRVDESGRATMTAGDGNPDDVVVEIIDDPAARSPATVADAVRVAHARALRTLSPSDGRLVAASGVRLPDGTGRVVIAVHHLGVDAVSWTTIVSGLARAWWQYRNGEPPKLDATGTSFRRWSRVLTELAERTDELDWWSRQLPPPHTSSRLDRSRDRLRSTVAIDVAVHADLAGQVLGTVTEAFGARPDTVLAAAVALAVGTEGAGPVSMMLENHGREEQIAPGADLSETVGWFTSFVPVAVDIPPAGPATTGRITGPRVAAVVKSLKDIQARMPDNGIAFGPLRWLRTGSPLRERDLPLITVNYLGSLGESDAGGEDTDAVATEFMPVADAPTLPPSIRGDMMATAGLTVTVGSVMTGIGRELRVNFTAAESFWDRADLERFARRWESALAALVGHVDSVGHPGPSESDVIGGGVPQPEIDVVLARLAAGSSRAASTVWPPTPLQQGLFYEHERLLGADPYVTQSIIEFDGDHHATTLLPAVRQLLARQRVLRSAFVRTTSGRLVVVVPPADHPTVTDPDFRAVDLTDLDHAAAHARILQIAGEDRDRRFLLDSASPIRFSAVSHDTSHGRAHTLVITAHHIVLDGWSGPILVADLLAAQLGRPAVTPAGDFEAYLRWLDGRDHLAAVAVWREQLADATPTLVAPNRAASETGEPRRHEVVVGLSADTRSALERRVRELGTTTSTVLHAAWSVLLSRLTGEQRVVFGETVSGRPADLDGVDAMIGLFINTVPVVADVDPRRSLAALIGDLHDSRTRVLDHQFVGLGEIAAATGHPGLFDTLVVVESYPVDADMVVEGSRSSGLPIRNVTTSDATHYPLALIVADDGDGLRLTVRADLAAVGDGVAEVVAATVTDVLDAVIDDPAVPVMELDPMPADMRETIVGWSGSDCVGVEWSGRSVGSVVAERVGLSWGSVAVRCGDRVVSYG